MANTAAGQAVMQAWKEIEDDLFAIGALNRIMDAQGEHIRLQNISQMSQGKNRNGQSLGSYSEGHRQARRDRGYPTGKVDLKMTGEFQDGIKVANTKAKINRNGTADLSFEIRVAPAHEGRLKGFRSGRYGKVGRAIKRPVIGMADPGTALRTAQEKQLVRIAKKEYAKELKSAGISFTTKDI